MKSVGKNFLPNRCVGMIGVWPGSAVHMSWLKEKVCGDLQMSWLKEKVCGDLQFVNVMAQG